MNDDSTPTPPTDPTAAATPASGSRWEPAAADPASGAPIGADPDEATAPPDLAANPAAGREPAPTPRRPRWRLAAAAAGLVAVGGLGGFALGHASADPDGPDRIGFSDTGFEEHGNPGHLDGDGGRGPGPSGGQDFDGHAPGDGYGDHGSGSDT